MWFLRSTGCLHVGNLFCSGHCSVACLAAIQESSNPPFNSAWISRWKGLKRLPEKDAFPGLPLQSTGEQNSERREEPSSSWDGKAPVRWLGSANGLCVRRERLKTLLTQKITTQEERKQQLEASQTQEKKQLHAEEMLLWRNAYEVSGVFESAMQQQQQNVCGWACRPSTSHRHHQPPIQGSRQASGRWRKHVRSAQRAP